MHSDSPRGSTGAEERYAYLVSRYPAVTHAFIAEEVRALREAGVRVETFSVRRSAADELVSDNDRREFEATEWLVPARPLSLIADHLRAFGRSPRSYVATLVRSLRLGTGGPRSTLWRVFYFAEAIRFWRLLRAREVRHIHVHFPNVASDVAMLATIYANRTARRGSERWTWSMTLHGPTEFSDVSVHNLPVKVQAADAVICTSDWSASQVLAWAPPTDPARVHVVRCGVDIVDFAPREPLSPVPSSRVRVLNVAGMAPRKGHLVLLRALATLRSRGRDVVLTLVGDGPERSALEAESARLGLGDAVAFRGALGHDAVRDCYAEADIFCLPSFAEGVPTVLMEAMACGLPIVATNICGTPELVEDGSRGLLVPPARDDALADALDRLVSDESLRTRLGREARSHIESQRELHAVTGELREVFAAIAT
jgi:colanic acid/amylovoran biosynthesis glycosyltransferase